MLFSLLFHLIPRLDCPNLATQELPHCLQKDLSAEKPNTDSDQPVWIWAGLWFHNRGSLVPFPSGECDLPNAIFWDLRSDVCDARDAVCGFKFVFWGQVTVQGLLVCVLGTDMALNLANIRDILASTIYKLTASQKGCRKKCTRHDAWVVLSLLFFKEVWRMLREAMDECLRVLKESNKSRFDSYSVRSSVLITSHITFRDCRAHIFSDNLSRNSCIRRSVMLTINSRSPWEMISGFNLEES